MLSETNIDDEFKHRCDLLAEIHEDCSDLEDSYFRDVEGMADILVADMAWYMASAVSYNMVNSLTKLGREGVDHIWLKTIDALGLSPHASYNEMEDMEALLNYAGVIGDDEEDEEE
jgi:hypothetical protein